MPFPVTRSVSRSSQTCVPCPLQFSPSVFRMWRSSGWVRASLLQAGPTGVPLRVTPPPVHFFAHVFICLLFFLRFFGFGGCGAAACSGAELAAALLHAASASCWSSHRTRFFGFSVCGAAARSGAELAAALLLAFWPLVSAPVQSVNKKRCISFI